MGHRHARVVASRPDRFELAAVMDLDDGRARAVAEAHGAIAATTERDAIDRADAVIVATPIESHAAIVERALRAGRHVLVEKPIAATARAAACLLAVAEARGARLFVGHSERFNPVVRALARLVDASDVCAIDLLRVGASATSTPDHGALVNLGVHDLDIAALLTRSEVRPAIVVGDAASRTEPRACVVGRAGSGAAIVVHVDQQPQGGERRRQIALATSTHVWRGDLLAPSLVRTCRATGAREAVPLGTEEPLAAQALAFASAVRGGAAPIATGLDGLRALVAAEEARRLLHLS
jgi:predicted dehydrogenase